MIASKFFSYIRNEYICNEYVELCQASVCNTVKAISASEWVCSVMTCDELLSIVVSVFDDLRHKFTSNIKAEFTVKLSQMHFITAF